MPSGKPAKPISAARPARAGGFCACAATTLADPGHVGGGVAGARQPTCRQRGDDGGLAGEQPALRGLHAANLLLPRSLAELKGLGVNHLFGLSTQDPEYHREAAERLHLPFAILSDERLRLTRAMKLPTFETSGMTLLKRFTLVIDDGAVTHVFYPAPCAAPSSPRCSPTEAVVARQVLVEMLHVPALVGLAVELEHPRPLRSRHLLRRRPAEPAITQPLLARQRASTCRSKPESY
jgi:hypothetical protein